MKRKLTSLVALAACAGAPMAAQAQSNTAAQNGNGDPPKEVSRVGQSATIYGRIDLSADYSKNGSVSQMQLRDNASRLGFRGTEDLGGGLVGTFGLEMGINADSGLPTTPFFRNSYVGLVGGFGAFAMGRLDSANPTGSPIYTLVTRHSEFVIHDAGATAVGTSVLNARNRVSNAFGYQSPYFADLVFRARYYMNGEGVTESATGPIRFESDFKQFDVSLSYEPQGPLGLGIGYGKDDRRGGIPTNGFKDKWLAVAGYNFGPVRAWAIVGQDNYNGTATTRNKVDIRYIGASAPLPIGKVSANYSTRDVQTDRNGQLTKFSIGYSYPLSKRTQLFAIYDQQDPNNKVVDNTLRTVSLGIQHNF
ncbi:porin [Ramlibacter solisilvae]|uniref:Porin n=1 Tax=Ramlibacter tataouinensis TaxID=94132 RepID=A0A127JRT7_9BURK|nr:porin [Ramlibacter tataouinensis]AMO22676.1 porin [Ramlibacter tataouinensis]